MKAGELQPVHIGRSCRLSRAELERYVRRLEAPEPVPPRRRPRKATPANQGDLFALCSNPVDEASAVNSRPWTSHRTTTLDAVDEQRRRGRDDELRGTAHVAK